MNQQQAESTTHFIDDGQLNRVLGWAMLLTGLALAAVLDPWFFAAQSAKEFANSMRPSTRHAQGVVLGMALMQLAMAHLLATSAFDRKVRRTVALLITLGATVYTTGYAVGLMWPSFHWLVLLGSLLNFGGFVYLLWVKPSGSFASKIRLILPVVCFGMLLDFTTGLLHILPQQFVLDSFGADDGVRLRMLRLARVAMIVLSVLTLLYYGVARETERGIARWGGLALACGAIGMPAILAAACFTSLHLKYLLTLPATAVLTGVFIGLLLGLRHASPLERWGWSLIAASTSVGMLMGMFAFDGPLWTPQFLGEYNEIPRRLLRLAHSYSIVFGVLAIFLARERNGRSQSAWPTTFGMRLFVTGSAVTIGVLVVRIFASFSPSTLSIGPVVALAGAVVCLIGVRIEG